MSEGITLTSRQLEQLHDFVKEQDQAGSFILRPAATLGGDQIEAVLLDEAGEPTSKKRILFPS